MGNETDGRLQSTPLAKNRWARFNSRRGTGAEPFAQRLARARLLFLRRRETAANWLALAVALALYTVMGWTNLAYATALDGVRAGSLLMRNRSGLLQPAARVDTQVAGHAPGARRRNELAQARDLLSVRCPSSRAGGPLRFEVTAQVASIASRAASVAHRQRNLREQTRQSAVATLTKKVMT